MGQKVLAKGDTMVHVVVGRDEATGYEDVQSRIVSYGDSVPAEDVAKYQLEDIKAGNQPLLELVSDSAARKEREKVDKAKAEAETTERVSMSEQGLADEASGATRKNTRADAKSDD